MIVPVVVAILLRRVEFCQLLSILLICIVALINLLTNLTISFFALSQISCHIDANGSLAQNIVTLLGCYIVLNGLLERLTLLMNAHFHFAAQFLIDFKVLDLKLAISFFLRIDKFRRHAIFHV